MSNPDTYQEWKIVYFPNPPAFFDILIPGAPPGRYKTKLRPKKDKDKGGMTIMIAHPNLQEPTEYERKCLSAKDLIQKYDYPHLIVNLSKKGADIVLALEQSLFSNMHASFKIDGEQVKCGNKDTRKFMTTQELKEQGFTEFFRRVLAHHIHSVCLWVLSL